MDDGCGEPNRHLENSDLRRLIEMIGRRAVASLSLLCALVVCAFAASNAMAVVGTTAYTCKEVLSAAKFSDEHCTKTGFNEGFVDEEIKPKFRTLLSATNTITGSELSFPSLTGSIAGVEFNVEAGGFRTCINKVSVENKENGSKQMEAAGEFCGEFYGVQVNKPANCEIKGGLVTLNEKGEGKTVVKEAGEKVQEMYIELIPPEKKPFASFTFEGAECIFKGVTAEVTGTARANVTTEEGLLNGPTLRFTAADTEKTLKVAGNAAKFVGTFTMRMQPMIGSHEDPVLVTTTGI